jgi:ribosomal protein L18E
MDDRRQFKPRGRMARELPKEIISQVNDLMTDGATYDEVAAWLNQRGYDISRSAVGRYGQKFFEFRQQALHFRDQADALRGAPGEALTIDEVITQAIQQQIMAKLMDGTLDVTEAPKLLGELARLQGAAINREKLKQDFMERAKTAAESVEKIAKTGGLSDDTVQEIRARILGVAE